MIKKVVFISLILLFGLLFFQSRNSRVNAIICGSCSQYDCCGDPCTANQHCSGTTVYGCGCDIGAPTTKPTNTPAPQPTNTPAPQCGGCGSKPKPDCANAPACNTGQCFPVCNYTTCNWSCTAGGSNCNQLCSNWSNWVCAADGLTETRYCTSPAFCTNVAQARQPCSAAQPTSGVGNPSPTGGGGGATNTPAPPTATPTPGAGPWVKLKDSSHFSRTALYNNIPTSPIIYDSEDTTQPYYILGASGVVGAPSVNITGLNANAKTGSPEYKIGYTPTTYAMTPNNFISYMKSRKEYTKITSVDQITGAGIYYLEFDLTSGATVSATLTSVPAAFNSNNVVLVTNGEIDINMANFNPTNSVAIIADIIKFNASVTQANGLFLANSIYTGVTSNQGLKINGNFVAQQYFANQRKWSSNSRPSFFTVFKPKLYLDLLPYLSIVNYEWKQLQ